jgi:hypothetical protein
MVQFAVLMAGLLLIVESQASDVADSSALQGFLSNYVPAATQRRPTSLNGYVPQGLSEAEYKARMNADAAKKTQNKLKYPKGKAYVNVKDYLLDLQAKQKFKGGKVVESGHAYVKTKFDWTGSKKQNDEKQRFGSPFNNFVLPAVSNVKHGNEPGALAGTSPFTIVDDTPVLHPATQVQDSTAFTPMSLAAIGIGLLSLVTVLGFRLRRGLQPAALGDNVMELKSQDSHVKGTPARVVGGSCHRRIPIHSQPVMRRSPRRTSWHSRIRCRVRLATGTH